MRECASADTPGAPRPAGTAVIIAATRGAVKCSAVGGWLGLNSDLAPNSRLGQLQGMTTPAMEIKVEANALFKAGNYQEAAECYSRAMACCV
eukprot:COSAG02_NODE_36000_length_460_cov_0.980609_1_plen_91_part_10